MKIVHMADSHLGFTSYSRVDKHGRNVVEGLFYQGFEQAVAKIIEINPDAVVHSGDVFHHVRPGIRPLYHFKVGLEKLQKAGIPVILISGNHDSPKSFAGTSPFVIYQGMKGVHISRKYEYEFFEEGDYKFHCIPFCLDSSDYTTQFSKIETSGKDVLVMHGLVESLRNRKLHTVGEHELNDSLLKKDFDYIALGHYHARARIATNAWYSGSLEYFNFGEARDEKGLLLVDLETGEVKPVEVRPRYMADLEPLDCSGLSTEMISERLMELCDPGVIKDKIVRVNLTNVDRSAYKNVNQASINRLISPALYLKVRVDFAEEKERRDREPIDRFSLQSEFEKFMEAEISRGLIPKSIKEDLVAYGSDLVKKAVSSGNTEVLDAPQQAKPSQL